MGLGEQRMSTYPVTTESREQIGELRPFRLLVVDDSSLYRKAICDVLAGFPDIEVVGVAANGKIALDKIEQLSPDLITLDLEMPELDGHGVLARIGQQRIEIGVLILSATSKQGARDTTRALEAGAFDFVLKPTSSNADESKKQLADSLLPKIRAYQEKLWRRQTTQLPSRADVPQSICRVEGSQSRSQKIDLVAIGISTGGPASLAKLIPQFPKDFPAPILIVQHMPPMFTASLAEELDRTSPLSVQEGRDGMTVSAGMVVIAPGGKQMKLERSAGVNRIVVTDDPPERNCRPSVDYLFRSLSNLCAENCLGVIMTGMGDDGLLGCQLLKRKGATVLAQDESSSVVYGMPRQIAENGLADAVCSLDELSAEIKCLVKRRAH